MNGNETVGDGPAMTRRFRFTRRQRLRRRSDFSRVFRCGVHAADQTLVVHLCRNGLSYSRLGVSVSKRVGNAVVRNRWKRWIREAFRTQQHELPAGFDIVVRPRRGAVGEYRAVARSLPRLVERAHRRLADRP